MISNIILFIIDNSNVMKLRYIYVLTTIGIFGRAPGLFYAKCANCSYSVFQATPESHWNAAVCGCWHVQLAKLMLVVRHGITSAMIRSKPVHCSWTTTMRGITERESQSLAYGINGHG